MCILIDLRCCIKLFSIKKIIFLPTDLKKIHKVTGNYNYFFVRPYTVIHLTLGLLLYHVSTVSPSRIRAWQINRINITNGMLVP